MEWPQNTKRFRNHALRIAAGLTIEGVSLAGMVETPNPSPREIALLLGSMAAGMLIALPPALRMAREDYSIESRND